MAPTDTLSAAESAVPSASSLVIVFITVLTEAVATYTSSETGESVPVFKRRRLPAAAADVPDAGLIVTASPLTWSTFAKDARIASSSRPVPFAISKLNDAPLEALVVETAVRTGGLSD